MVSLLAIGDGLPRSVVAGRLARPTRLVFAPVRGNVSFWNFTSCPAENW